MCAYRLSVCFLAIVLVCPGAVEAQADVPVAWWLTTHDLEQKLSAQPDLTFVPGPPSPPAAESVIVVDDGQQFQRFVGLGSSLEHATCFNLAQLAEERRAKVIERLVHPERGIGINLARICIGTPDFTGDDWYTYDDRPAGETDPRLEHFSIEKDRRYVLPILRQALAANPDLLFFASPWSPPGWMKSTGNMIGGRLLADYYDAYAHYFVRFVQAYQAEGIPIHAVTVQNEPGVDRSGAEPRWRYPSCRYTAEQERDFIKNHLGPAFAHAGLKTEIWTYDHNFNIAPTADGDDPGIGYPRTVLSDPAAARFVAGVAFHGYAGQPSGMAELAREFPQKPIHFSEGSVFGPTGGKLLVEYLRNGASSYNGWVTMLDTAGKPNNGPFRASRTCVTLNHRTGEVDYHYDYYQYGHFFRHLRRGAVRVASTGEGAKLAHVAARNPDGTLALVVVNTSREAREFTIVWRDQTAPARLPPQSIATFAWDSKALASAADPIVKLAGITVTPHLMAPELRYARDPDPELGARVQLYLRNRSANAIKLLASQPIRLRGKSADEWLASNDWTWHDFPSAWPQAPLELPAGGLTVWTFNGRSAAWGAGTRADLELTTGEQQSASVIPVEIAQPLAWLSAVTFLADDEQTVAPNSLLIHVANEGEGTLEPIACRLWLPASNATFRALLPREEVAEIEIWPHERSIAPHDKGIVRVRTNPLPLTYTAVELLVRDAAGQESSLWGHLRIKRECFDISGGWVAGGRHAPQTMSFEPFLKTLRRLHVNTAHLADSIPGYTDQTQPGGLYDRYPLKFFNALLPTDKYETPDMLSRVHAVEFLGEPQYGGGRPVPPMEVWQKLSPYQATKLPTTVTHSEERIWRYYAGLSDFPHYDAYRVCAPSPDAWLTYSDRWGGKKIGWGAPLETIGDMCRSLRELNRPMPTAYWSQGPHHGWGPMWGRRRASPTPDELRLQAYHALSSRITSLYWFNLSLPSLVKYRDTLDELTRVGREMRLLSDFYLSGNAYEYRRLYRNGSRDWDLASIVAPQGALLFALDLRYEPDKDERVFVFGPPRLARFAFKLPAWCRQPAELFRVDADGTHDVEYQQSDEGVEIRDTVNKVAIYVVAPREGARADLESRLGKLTREEEELGFDPSANDEDFGQLETAAKRLSDQQP